MEICRVAPGVRRQQGAFSTSPCGRATGSPCANRCRVVAISCRTARLTPQPLSVREEWRRQTALAKGVLQLKYRLRQLLAIVTIRLVCLQQGRQLVAAQSGGQPRAPGLGAAAISGVARLARANSDCS